MTRMTTQRRQVLLLLISWLLVVVKGLNNCLQSREAYANLGLGPPEDVPVNFTIGKLQIFRCAPYKGWHSIISCTLIFVLGQSESQKSR